MTDAKIAFNPLPWTLQHGENKGDFDRQRLELTRSLSEMSGCGIAGVTLFLPGEMTAGEFQGLLGEYGYVAAPGFVGFDLEETSAHAAAVEATKSLAEIHAGLGLTEVFLACNSCPERYARPAEGFMPDDDRVRRITDGMVLVAECFARAGVSAGFHPHVGGWIETEAEIRQVMDRSRGTALAFGPDTGHLVWAGADLPRLLRDYRDRIAGLHVKDVHLDRAKRARTAAASYWTTTREFNVWTEPGRGDIDFRRVFDALGGDWDGWVVLEVDKPEAPSPAESAMLTLEHVRNLWR